MTPRSLNPFPKDPDRHEIWEVLMRRDFEAFLAADWSRVASDFLEDEFLGIDGGRSADPDRWQLGFPDLGRYRDAWLAQAAEFRQLELKAITKLDFCFEAASLGMIDINGGRALAHKKFDGSATTVEGVPVRLLWQTVYLMRKVSSRWKIAGFVGYLPNPAL